MKSFIAACMATVAMSFEMPEAMNAGLPSESLDNY
jgi:hypothetical protein